MTKMIVAIVSLVAAMAAFNVQAEEVCKVSVMGRICTNDNSAETAAHMKGNAVAEAEAKKLAAATSKDGKTVLVDAKDVQSK
ncbi:hypothetical protein [Methylovorus sp. MP688]|uniref:hypothetical protein n=1 Tax=Methylovorus sp. (strain MP688) TaxID=887061 RepID=UPI0001EC4532|nr:hypothetical protein [Methylovorus sp. MP688]ADQ84027.1 conserved hypothetical protein [Methylovorus sp. MP688]